MKIRQDILEKASVVYLLVPLFLFVIFWLKPIFSILVLLILILIYKKLYWYNEKDFDISRKYLLIIISLCLIWCIISGIGGFYYQSLPDWNIKNALMHDLIEFNWPVTYDNGTKLVYYFGTFLPSAFIGKAAKLIGLSSNSAFFISNTISLLWALLGIVLVMLNIFSYVGINKRNPLFITLVFIFFSGMDILLPIHPEFIHIEWHPLLIQYSSIMTMMVWAYNQAIAPWLVTILFLKSCDRVEQYGILGVLSLFYAPLTFIGFSVFLIVKAVVLFFSNKDDIKKFFIRIFDFKNILSVLVLIPLLYLFYKSNYTAEYRKIITVPYNIHTIQFVVCECVLYLILIWKKFYKSPIFYITLLSLIAIPFFRLVDCLDFSMRASVPAIFIMAVMVIRFLFEETKSKTDTVLKVLLGVFLLVGACTPLCEITRGLYYVFFNHEQLITKDYVASLNNKIDEEKDWVTDVGDYKNYGCFVPEKSIFFKYLSR